jgi:glycosyltransferase involved in cell wall biosynthesis
VRVAHLTSADSTLRLLLLPQLRAIVEAGGEVAGISAPGPWVDELEAAGIRHVPLRSATRAIDPLSDLKAAWELAGILRRHRFDILHTHNPKPGIYGRIVGRLSGVPIVVNTVHGLFATETDALLKRLAVYGAEAIAARFSDAELVQSAEDMAMLARWHITRRRSTRHLGNGVDLRRFDPTRVTETRRRSIRSELGAREDQIVVGMVGRLVEEKGYPELFEAVTLLGDRYVVLAIGPEDPGKVDALPPSLIDRARDHGVRFLGMRDDLEELYGAMDIFVLPSHREGVPRAAIEATAVGLPLVATNVRGCREVVQHGVNGFLVPVASPRELAAAIRRLGEDPDARRAMGRAGRRLAERSFDEERVVGTVLDTYRRIAQRKGVSGTLRSNGAGTPTDPFVSDAEEATSRAVTA